MQKNLKEKTGWGWARNTFKNLWQKLGNGWKLLLTVVLNVTGFLDLTVKCIDLDQGNKVFNLPLT